MEANKLRLLFFCVFYLAVFPTLKANIGDFDEVWQKRSHEAKRAAQQAYKPNPEEVTTAFNNHVHKYVCNCIKNLHLLCYLIIFNQTKRA